MQYFPEFMHFKKLPIRSLVVIHFKWIWDPLIGNLPEIRLRDFLYQGAIFRKNRAEVSEKKVSILRVFTALHGRG